MSSGRGKTLNKISLFGALLIPAGFLYFFSQGKQNFKEPDYYGPMVPEIVDGQPTGDSVHFKVPNFNFTLISGKEVSLDDYKDKIIIAAVIGTSCPDDCEIQPEAFKFIIMKELQEKGYDDVVILTELVNYDSDETPTASDIRSYYNSALKFDRWDFFTADVNGFFDYPATPGTPNMYRTIVDGTRGGKGYYSLAVIIDKERHVRGVYNLKRSSAYARDLLDGIKLLKKKERYE